MSKDVHVIKKSGNGWAVRRSAAPRARKLFKTKAAAKTYGIELAKWSEVRLVEHNSDGSIHKITDYRNV